MVARRGNKSGKHVNVALPFSRLEIVQRSRDESTGKRLNVALPFSRVKVVDESSADLAALASEVADLADLLVGATPGQAAAAVAARCHELSERLGN